MKFDERIQAMIDLFRSSLPGWTVIAVPDCTNLEESQSEDICKSFPIEALPITADFVRNNDLHFYQNRTGWLCGDYVVYRALDLDWDFAWVVEPDVYFLNGAEDILKRLQALEHDLLATHLWVAGPGWLGTGALNSLIPELTVHAMAFPFFRVSRRVAIESFKLRKRISTLLKPDSKVPNDEAVLATAAYNMGATLLDIRSLYEEQFEIWSTLTRVNIEDVQQVVAGPRIVHSGQLKGKYMNQMENYWAAAIEGSEFCRRQLLASLETSSHQTLLELIPRFLEASKKENS